MERPCTTSSPPVVYLRRPQTPDDRARCMPQSRKRPQEPECSGSVRCSGVLPQTHYSQKSNRRIERGRARCRLDRIRDDNRPPAYIASESDIVALFTDSQTSHHILHLSLSLAIVFQSPGEFIKLSEKERANCPSTESPRESNGSARLKKPRFECYSRIGSNFCFPRRERGRNLFLEVRITTRRELFPLPRPPAPMTETQYCKLTFPLSSEQQATLNYMFYFRRLIFWEQTKTR